MIARGFKPVAWVGAIAAAALGCYMLSLQVAAERAELAGLERRILSTQQEIRALQTELGTRGRLQQLEQWNAEVLALSAPVAGQFLADHVSLARFDASTAQVADQIEVRMAAAELPSAARAPTPVVPHQAAMQPAADVPPLAQAPPPLVRASLATPTARLAEPSAPVVARPATPQVRTAAAVDAPARRPAVLLDERTLRDLNIEARAERRGGTRN